MTSPGSADLSPRENQVMRLIAAGHTNAEMAAELGISVRTVEMHRERVLQKLSLSSRADIVRYAVDRGYLGA